MRPHKDAEAIQKWITEEPKILEVQGDHPDEAFAFYMLRSLLFQKPKRQPPFHDALSLKISTN